MIIIKETGHIQITSEKVIRASMSLSEISALNIVEDTYQHDIGNGWLWFVARNVIIADAYFIFSCALYQDRLSRIMVVRSLSKFDFSKGWESWNEAEEKQKAIDMNEWLSNEIGSNRTFNWGKVWVGYDDRSMGSSIEITYGDALENK